MVGIPLMAPGIGGAACRDPARLVCWVLLLSVIRQCLIVVGNPEDDTFEAEVEASLQLGAFANTASFCSPALSVCPASHWAILNFRVTMAREMSHPQQCAAWRTRSEEPELALPESKEHSQKACNTSLVRRIV